MSSTTSVFKGIVHGKTIELSDELGLPDGQQVTVTVHPAAVADQKLPPGEGMRRAFGAWADDATELDKFLEWNRQQRKVSRRELAP